ncbi:MAG: response regulator [Sulfurimonas sp.]|nr:response regulator [Sulfurimonas sp.]
MDSSKIKDLLNISKDIRILYVEDNTDARDTMVVMLKNFFSAITVGVDGEDGLAKFNDSTIDLILTDINMPKMNGIEMINEIRKVSQKIPILILTATNHADISAKTENFAISGYLLKPIDISQLVETLFNTVKQITLNNGNQEE